MKVRLQGAKIVRIIWQRTGSGVTVRTKGADCHADQISDKQIQDMKAESSTAKIFTMNN